MTELEPIASSEPPAPIIAPTGPRVCFVKFRNAGRVYPFASGDLELAPGALVLVDHEQTQQVGVVMRAPAPSPHGAPTRVLRALTDDDRARFAALRDKEKKAFAFALAKLHERRLPAKMVAAELSFNEDRLQIYFASEERLDFRALIRDISSRYQTRIDIRQIGARDAAKIIGGVGSCGRELCCSTWLVEFRPVSIKMAKDQNLALNPQKVSGVCGRLLCCLTYEQETYRELRRGLPKIGKRVYTPSGEARVKDINVLRRRVRVQTMDGYEEFDAEEVSPMFGPTGELLQPGNTVVEPEEVEGESETDSGTVQTAPPVDRPAAPMRARDERPRDDRPRQDRPPQDRPRDDRPRQDRPRQDRPPQDRARDDRPRQDRPRQDRPRDDRPRDDRPRQDRPPQDRPRDDRPQQDRPPGEAPRDNSANPPRADGQPDNRAPAGEGGEPGQRRRRRRRRRGGGGGGGGNPGPQGAGGGAPGGSTP